MNRSIPIIAALVLTVAVTSFAQTAELPADPAEYGDYYYQRWLALTEGENVALGQPFEFNVPSNYYICQEGDNGAELTDGWLNMRENYRIWFSRQVAGWSASPIRGN